MPFAEWLYPVLIGLAALNLLLLLRRSTKKGYWPLALGLTGVAVIVGGRSLFPQERWLLFVGIAAMVAGSLVGSFTLDRYDVSAFKMTRKEGRS